jgi:hypothetical protein
MSFGAIEILCDNYLGEVMEFANAVALSWRPASGSSAGFFAKALSP